MYEYSDFLADVLRIARQKKYKIECLRGTSIPQIDFGHKKLHGGHLEKLFPAVLGGYANIAQLIEEVAPGRSCAHKPFREIVEEIKRERAGKTHGS